LLNGVILKDCCARGNQTKVVGLVHKRVFTPNVVCVLSSGNTDLEQSQFVHLKMVCKPGFKHLVKLFKTSLKYLIKLPSALFTPPIHPAVDGK
jgi:hypothetical protein